MNDSQLIQDYASSRSDEAFKSLVDQYVGLVFSACFRQLKDRHLAEDATQAVFILLSRKAGAFRPAYLSGWLLTTSRYACANIRRSEQRRRHRERAVATNQPTQSEPTQGDLLDHLDEALCHLSAGDREALVLRYFEEQPIDDIAKRLGVSPQTARKRVDRGIGKLRRYFSRRGLSADSASLVPLLADQLRGAALPPAARQAITQGILQVFRAGPQSAAASVAIAKGTNTMMILTKIKSAAVVVLIAIIAAALGTMGWMTSRAGASNSAADPAAVPANAAPLASSIAPPSVPTTAPSPINLATPEDAVRSFFVAVKNGDNAGAYACLTADPNRAPNPMDAMLAWNLAQNRLVYRVTRSFGGDGDEFKRLITIDSVAPVMFPDGGLHADLDGDGATIPIKIIPQFIELAPANYQPILRAWSNAKLYFRKQNDLWKFDIDRSLHIVARIFDKNSRRIDRATTVAIMLANAQADDQITAAVEAGQFATSNDAASALNAADKQIARNHKVSSTQFNIVPANGAD